MASRALYHRPPDGDDRRGGRIGDISGTRLRRSIRSGAPSPLPAPFRVRHPPRHPGAIDPSDHGGSGEPAAREPGKSSGESGTQRCADRVVMSRAARQPGSDPHERRDSSDATDRPLHRVPGDGPAAIGRQVPKPPSSRSSPVPLERFRSYGPGPGRGCRYRSARLSSGGHLRCSHEPCLGIPCCRRDVRRRTPGHRRAQKSASACPVGQRARRRGLEPPVSSRSLPPSSNPDRWAILGRQAPRGKRWVPFARRHQFFCSATPPPPPT